MSDQAEVLSEILELLEGLTVNEIEKLLSDVKWAVHQRATMPISTDKK